MAVTETNGPDNGRPPHTEQIPPELRERRQWICWTNETRGDKLSKFPKHPDGSGRSAKTNDDTTWGTFEDAVKTATTNSWGVGFVFSAADPYVGIDVDACLGEEGNPAEWLPPLDVLGKDVYIERSPSGEGLHIIAKDAKVPGWWKNQHEGNREVAVFEDGRYFTFTGDAVQGDDGQLESPDDLERWLRSAWQAFNSEPPGGTDESQANKSGSQDVGVYDLAFVSRGRYPPEERRAHPVHGSSTGTNFMVDDGGETWRCWRHDVTGNALHLLGVERGVIECGEWNRGSLDSPTWHEIFQEARDAGIIDESRSSERGMASNGSDDTVEPPVGDEIASPAAVKSLAGLEKDESLKSLGTARRAHYAWQWIAEHDNVLAAQPGGELYAYEDGVWTPEGKQRLRELGQSLLGAYYSERCHRELCERARANAPVDREALGTPDGKLPVANGLLDLDERTVRPLRPEDHALVRLPVAYDPDADCQRWLTFIDEVVPERWHKAVQEFVGYCLCVGRLPIHRALMLVGEGANGKSTFLGTVRALLGDENVRAHTLHDIAQEAYARADLFGAVANIHADLSSRSLGSGSEFKTLVGGDTVQARRLYENYFEFDPTAKQLFATNQVPEVDIEDPAFFRRWLVVEFPSFIPRDERDPNLQDKLTADEELSGILNWALEGRDRLLEQGRFTGEGDPVEKKSRWLSWGDSVSTFIEECVDLDSNGGDRYTSSDVYEAYVAYCQEHGEDPVSQQKLTTELKTAGGNYGKHRIAGKVQRGFKGLTLTREVPDRDSQQQQLSQSKVVTTVLEAIDDAAPDGHDGAPLKDVLDLAEERGVNRNRAEKQIESLTKQGEILRGDNDRLQTA